MKFTLSLAVLLTTALAAPAPPACTDLKCTPPSTSVVPLPSVVFPTSTKVVPLPSVYKATSVVPLPSVIFPSSTKVVPMPSVIFPSSTKVVPMPSVIFPSSTMKVVPMPSVIKPEPKMCTKICARKEEDLECGEGWYAWNAGEGPCWACCRD